jgi:molybdopterin molybdotransferase
MLEFDDALGRVLARAPRLGSEELSIALAQGRVLVEPVYATRALPEYDHSAMDGYALSSEDCSGGGPWRLRVRGESRAGTRGAALERGTVQRIFTGALLPAGADSVVMQEDAERSGDEVILARAPRAGEHVRRRGEDLEAGQLGLGEGTRLGPGQLGLMAALDRVTCTVSLAPKLSVLCTGDELRPAGSTGREGSIPESNSVALAALARNAGASVVARTIVPDDEQAIADALGTALAASDVVVTVGGVSVGERDLVRPALERLGASVDFWKVRIKPGKPFLLAHAGTRTILGLPGNPVSAFVTFTLLGMPLLRAMQHDAHPSPPERLATLSLPVRQKPGRLGFYRATLLGDQVTPLANQASGAVTSTAWANALIRVPSDSEGYERGQRVSVIPLDQ